MDILGVDKLVGDEPVMARSGKSLFPTRWQAAGLVRVAARRAAWQTAQTLAGYLEEHGHPELGAELRAMTSEELADGVDVSAEIPAPEQERSA